MTTPDGHQISSQYFTLLLSYGNKMSPKWLPFCVMLSHFLCWKLKLTYFLWFIWKWY